MTNHHNNFKRGNQLPSWRLHFVLSEMQNRERNFVSPEKVYSRNEFTPRAHDIIIKIVLV